MNLGLCPVTMSKHVIQNGVLRLLVTPCCPHPVSVEKLRAQSLVSDVADDAEQLRPLLAMFLSREKVAPPHASLMSKELVREEQVDGIKGLFEQMMHPGANGAHDEKRCA